MSAHKAERMASPPPTKFVIYWQLTILIGLTLIRGLIYLAIFPPWVAPDEPAHFEVIRIIGQEGQIPSKAYYQATSVNPELSQSFQTFRMWELLERVTPTQFLSDTTLTELSFINYPYPGKLVYADSYPILPHLLVSPLSKAIAAFDIATELYILRFFSVVLAIGVTVIAWLITRRVFPEQPQFWLAIPAFVVFLPMYTHIFASVNTDVFAILLTSTLLLILISFFDLGVSKLKVIFVVVLVFSAFFTKRTVVFTFLWAALTAILYFGQRRQWLLKRIGIIGLISLTLMGVGLWSVIINADLLPNSMITLFNMNIGKEIPLDLLTRQSLLPAEIAVIYIKSGLFAFITFWGDFGGANINIPWPWAWGLMGFCGVIIFGAFSYLARFFRETENSHHYQRYIFIIFLIGIGLSLLNSFFPVLVAGPSWGPPARYFFPVIIPIATFFFLGAWQLFPAKYRQTYLLPVWLGGLVAYDALVMSLVLIPFLYG